MFSVFYVGISMGISLIYLSKVQSARRQYIKLFSIMNEVNGNERVLTQSQILSQGEGGIGNCEEGAGFKFENTIEFKNVYFKYHGRNQWVLQNVSFVIHKNRKYGFTGFSGSGKSTIFQLLLRFYRVTKGLILIDDVDINEIDLAMLRQNISYVSQDTFIFSDNLKKNIILN